MPGNVISSTRAVDVIIQAVSAPLMVEPSTRPGCVRGAGAGADAAAAGAGAETATAAGAAGAAAGADASLAGAAGADAAALATGMGVEATLAPVWAPACWKTSPIQKHKPIAMDRLIAIQDTPFFRNQTTFGNRGISRARRSKLVPACRLALGLMESGRGEAGVESPDTYWTGLVDSRGRENPNALSQCASYSQYLAVESKCSQRGAEETQEFRVELDKNQN